MKIILALIICLLVPILAIGNDFQVIKLKIDICDEYIVKETEQYKIEFKKELPLRFADVQVKPKKDRSFDLMLYFKCDTKDLAVYDSPKKIEKVLRESSQKYLPYSVETSLDMKEINWKGQYGYYLTFTDIKLAKETNILPGQFKYITRGMVRISQNVALGFSIMSNKIHTQKYNEILNYIKEFIREQ